MGGFKSITFDTLVALLFMAVVVAKDKDLSSSGLSVRALGKSGKITIVRPFRGKRADFSDKNEGKITVELDSIEEKDEANKVVGKRINNLASQDFSFSSVNKDAVYQGISALNVNLTASLDDKQAKLDIIIYIFREDGNLTFGNETFAVENGTLKFFIEIKDWKFCNGSARPPACKKNDVGKNLDVQMIVKSRGDIKQFKNDAERRAKKRKIICAKQRRRACPDSYDLDSGELILTREVKSDGKFEAMASDYPKFERKGGKNIFTFRVKKFNNTVLIDPAVNKDEDEEGQEPPGGGGSAMKLCFSMVIAVAAASVLYLS